MQSGCMANPPQLLSLCESVCIAAQVVDYSKEKLSLASNARQAAGAVHAKAGATLEDFRI